MVLARVRQNRRVKGAWSLDLGHLRRSGRLEVKPQCKGPDQRVNARVCIGGVKDRV